MLIRTILTEELERFSTLSYKPQDFVGRLSYLWENGLSSPDMCFVAEDSNEFVSGIVYWALPSLGNEIMLLDLFMNWENPTPVEKLLFKHSLNFFEDNGGKRIESRLFSDSTDFLFEKKNFFEKNGLPLIQEKKNYKLKKHILSVNNEEFDYKTLEEINEKEFIHALEKVSCKTLDSYENYLKNCDGNFKHARDLFVALKDIDYRKDLWKIVTHKKYGFVGVLVCQIIEDHTGLINYIGVLPTLRNKGYGRLIFEHGVNLLKYRVDNVVMDVDVNNLPMIRILNRSGFLRNYKVWIFKKELKV